MKRNGENCVIITGTNSKYDGTTGTLVKESLDGQTFSHKGTLSIGKRFDVKLHDGNGGYFDGVNLTVNGANASVYGDNLKRNDIVHKAKLLKVEVIAGRLYTGPM